MAKEQNTVGLTDVGSEHLRLTMETGWFDTELDACRVAMGVALSRGVVAPPDELVSKTTKYNLGTWDRDRCVSSVIEVVGCPPGEDLCAYSERLIQAGLGILATELSEEGALLSDVLERASDGEKSL